MTRLHKRANFIMERNFGCIMYNITKVIKSGKKPIFNRFFRVF